MAKTYEPIATTTLGSAGSFDFTSIPATFTDIVVVASWPSMSGAGALYFRVNGDGSDLYNQTRLAGDGSSAVSTNSGSYTLAFLEAAYGTGAGQIVMNFQNYANTTTFKSMISRFNQVGRGTSLITNTWRSTAAINRIVLSSTSGSFDTGAKMTIYGITAA